MIVHQRGLAFQAEITCRRVVKVNGWLFQVHALVTMGFLASHCGLPTLAFALSQNSPAANLEGHAGAFPKS
jgi:hypothetical protein